MTSSECLVCVLRASALSAYGRRRPLASLILRWMGPWCGGDGQPSTRLVRHPPIQPTESHRTLKCAASIPDPKAPQATSNPKLPQATLTPKFPQASPQPLPQSASSRPEPAPRGVSENNPFWVLVDAYSFTLVLSINMYLFSVCSYLSISSYYQYVANCPNMSVY